MHALLHVVPAADRPRVESTAQRLSVQAQAWAEPAGAQLSAALCDSVAVTVTAMAPALAEDKLSVLVRYSLWCCLLDDVFDAPDPQPVEMRRVARAVDRILDGRRVATSAEFFSTALAQLVAELRRHAPGPALTDRFAEALRDVVVASTEQVRRARRVARGVVSPPSAEDYLEVSSRHINYRSVLLALLMMVGEDPSTEALDRLDEVLVPASTAVRLANDLRTYERERVEGTTNILGLCLRDGTAVTTDYVSEQIVELEVRHRELLEKASELDLPASVEALGNSLRVALALYSVADLRPVQPSDVVGEPTPMTPKAVEQPAKAVQQRPEAAQQPPTVVRRAKTVPVYRTMPRLARDPLKAFSDIGLESDGDITRLHLGLFRPYLVTRPDHVQHILRDRADNYLREGALWEPLRRLNGHGIAGEGPQWAISRGLIQPLFSAKNVATLVDGMVEVIERSVDDLADLAASGAPLDVVVEMTRIVHGALVRAFFGGRIAADDADTLGSAIAAAFTSLGARLLMPFVPNAVPLPGDAAFRRSVRIVDDVIYPLVEEARGGPNTGGDLVSLLAHARDKDGAGLTDRQVRDDVVAMFIAGTETTALILTWLWVLLDSHPEVAARLYDEVDRVVGAAPPTRKHLAELCYTKQVLQEVLRLYPVGWLVPRLAAEADVLDGVPIAAGATVFLSPYLTHRLPEHWSRPEAFDPDRFAADRTEKRHRFAYFPFGAGAHQCLGSHFFTVEAQLIVAAVLRRYRPMVLSAAQVKPQAAASLRPRDRVEMVLRPVERREPAKRGRKAKKGNRG